MGLLEADSQPPKKCSPWEKAAAPGPPQGKGLLLQEFAFHTSGGSWAVAKLPRAAQLW